MKILITGGTGFIGKEVSKKLIDSGNKLILLSRPGSKNRKRLTSPEMIFFDYDYRPESKIPDVLMKETDAIINMAGEPIFTGRWNAKKMKDIKESRINTTRQIVEAISNQRTGRPKVLVSASAVGYYGPSDDRKITEDSPPGTDFLARVCKQWEREALKAIDFGVRVVILRTGIVIDKGGGALSKMILPFRFFIGGPIGSGKQYLSWIHRSDMADLYLNALTDPRLSGPINATTPNPVTMKELSKDIGKLLKRPAWLPIPAFMAKIIIGGSAQVVVTGQRVIPQKLLSIDYPFHFKDIENALKMSLP